MLSTYALYTLLTPSVSHAVLMEEVQQGILYYQTLVANWLTEGDPVMGQEVDPSARPEEYVETDYEFREPNEIMEEDGDTNEVPSEPPTSEVVHDYFVALQDPLDRTRSLEEEFTTLHNN